MYKKIIILAIAVLSLTSCSSKFAYNNLDWLVHWYLDDYVELNDEQKDIFDQQMTMWLKWHRSQELAQYVAHLKSLKEDVESQTLNSELIQNHMARGREHWLRLRDTISPQLGELALHLSDEQVIYFFTALEKENKETEEELDEQVQLSADERLEKRIDDLIEQVKERVGRLTAEQKAIVKQFAPDFRSTSLMWLAYRRSVQSEARRLFAARKDNPEFPQQLSQLLLNTDDYRSEEYLAGIEHNRKIYSQMLETILPTLTAKQKRKLIKNLDDMIDDFEDLSEV